MNITSRYSISVPATLGPSSLPSFTRRCALSIALLGVFGCDEASVDAEALTGPAGEATAQPLVSPESATPADPEQQPVDENLLDPLLAAEIAKDKLSALEPSFAPHHASCGTTFDRPGVRVNDVAITGAARQRRGSSVDCPADGALQPSDDALYFCYTNANDGLTWTYNQNIRTGVRGWTRDDLLRGRGSPTHCTRRPRPIPESSTP